jgi:hypothetical protein
MKQARMLLIILSMLCTIAFTHHVFAQDATLQVTKVKKAGTVTIRLNIDKDVIAKNIEVTATDVTNNDTANVAKKIADAFKDNGATAAGSKVVKTAPANTQVGFGAEPNDFITGKLNLEESFAPAADQAVGEIKFAPNPSNGQDTLVSSVEINAGYLNGLGLISFVAPADESIFELADVLNFSLDSAGYLTSMPSPADIIVFGRGAGTPTEFDLLVDPLDSVGDRGIETTLLTRPIAEPASLLLAATWLPIFALVNIRRYRKNQKSFK